MRRLTVMATVGALAASGALLASQAGAALTCKPTPYLKDNMVLTAAFIIPTDGPAAPAEVDATGCNIGVYVAPTSSGTVNGSNIYGANYYGVLVDQARAEISNAYIHDIGEPNPDLFGLQHGVGVLFVSGDLSGSTDPNNPAPPGFGPATGFVSNSIIERYQKGGISVAGDDATVDTHDNQVHGLGPVPYIAQNGIQYAYGANGQIYTNTVTDNSYTGCSNQDAAKTGCTPYVSTGILLYDINQPEVDTYNNWYRDNQRNLYVVTSSSLK